MNGNAWSRLRGLFARDTALSRVSVLAVHAYGTSTVQAPTGAPYTVQGTSVPAGSRAQVQGGRIVGASPALSYYEVEV